MSLDAGIGANSADDANYVITNSAKFEKDNVEWMHKTFAADPTGYDANGRRISTISMWVKRSEIGAAGISTIASWYPASGAANNNTVYQMGFTNDDEFQIGLQSQYVYHTTRKFRDTSAWYHIVVRNDTTQSAALDRVRIYVNGVQETEFSTNYVASLVAQNFECAVTSGNTTVTRIGSLPSNSWHFSGYIAEVNVVCNLSLSPDSFGEVDSTSGIWKPIEYKGDYNTNGFYLNFSDSSNLGVNGSGTGNFSLNNMSSVDQASDSPTNNFATWQTNVKHHGTNTADFTFSEGGTSPLRNGGNVHVYCTSTMAMHSGKWYMEYKVRDTTDHAYFGGSPITRVLFEQDNGYYLGQDGGGSIAYGVNAGNLYYWTGQHNQYTESNSTGDIIGVALDKDNNKIAFSKNGTFMEGSNGVINNPSTPSSMHEVQPPPYVWAFGAYTQSVEYQTNMGGFTNMTISSAESDANGYGKFEYAPPTGYYALCTQNLAEFG